MRDMSRLLASLSLWKFLTFSSQNDPSERIWLRTLLLMFSLLGIVTASVVNGTTSDLNTVTYDLTVLGRHPRHGVSVALALQGRYGASDCWLRVGAPSDIVG